MPRTATPPPAPQWRVLHTLEKLGLPGFHQAGDIIGVDQVRPESVLILLETGVIMPHLDPDAIAALPDNV